MKINFSNIKSLKKISLSLIFILGIAIIIVTVVILKNTSTSSSSKAAVTAGVLGITDPNCVCDSMNMCSNSCGASNTGLSCTRENGLGDNPTVAQKNNYCTRDMRTYGDADGDGLVNSLDYIYYVRVVNGGTTPPNINPDFNGDGHVSVTDRTIIINYLKNHANDTPVPTTVAASATSMPGMTMTPTGRDPSWSAAMGLWNPNPKFDVCKNPDGSINATSTANIKALHDSYKVKGPDGKWYPTWHPPVAVDPATGASCSFGHEHGRDPKGSELWTTKQIQNFFYYDANKNGVMDPDEEAVTGIPFGYANEQLDTYNAAHGLAWMRHEDHVGHKIEYANGEGDMATNKENNLLTGGVNVQNQSNNTTTKTGVKCYYLAKPHQGVSSPDAFTNNVHEVFYFADCRDPNNSANNEKISIAKMFTFGQPGGFTQFMPLCGVERRDSPQDFINLGTDSNNVNFPSVSSSQGDREIITRDCIEKGFLVPQGKFSGNLYEAWPASLNIKTSTGKSLVSGVNLLFDVEDANRYFYPEATKTKNGYNNPEAKTNLGYTMDLCYDNSLAALGLKARGGACDAATNFGAIKDITWDDPRSAFKGLHRGMYFQPGVLDNAGGTETVYSDPFGGNAQSTPFAGSIKQQISTKKLDYSQVFHLTIDPRVNDRVHDSGKNTVHAPN